MIGLQMFSSDNSYIVQISLKKDKYNYEFSTIIGENTYIIWIYYNRRMNRYILNISDENNEPILMGIPMLVGAKMIKRFAYNKLTDIKYLLLYNLEDGTSEIDENNISVALLFTFKEIV